MLIEKKVSTYAFDIAMDEEEEMIPTVTVPDGTDLSAVSGTDEDSSEE